MKQIEAKARRVQKYDRMFFWYVPFCAVFIGGLSLAANDWNWPPVIGGVVAGIAIGGVLGVLLRDTP